MLVPQSELDPEGLARRISEATREQLLVMASLAREAAKPDASVRVADVCEAAARHDEAMTMNTPR